MKESHGKPRSKSRRVKGGNKTATPDIIELALCEQNALMLRPGVLYRFSVRPGCEACERANEPYKDEQQT